ncbi:MAG: SO_0444 family Cu/Zn efflux transporter [Planctomycetota bacterium]|jgi:uncharacterized membrane protein YraQ (UPF0718 family)
MAFVQDFAWNTWSVLTEAAPWLLFGLLAAGLIKAWMPENLLSRWLGRPGFGSVMRAAIIGTPLPLCSCGVLPAAMTLRKEGASRGSTVSFLIATPENGVDSLAMSYALLGPFMMIVRPVASLVSAVFAGMLAEIAPVGDVKEEAEAPLSSCCGSSKVEEPEPEPAVASCCGGGEEPEQVAVASCCSSEAETEPEPVVSCCSSQVEEEPEPASCCSSEKKEEPVVASSCCSSNSEAANSVAPDWMANVGRGMRYAVTDILDDIKKWLMVGILAAGLINTLIEPDTLAEWGSGMGAMLIMLVVGLPMYICATASTPVAASLIAAGVSPGTALVFLMAGPATNVGSVAIVRNALGTPAVVAYLGGICLGALVFGLATDALIGAMEIDVMAQVEHSHEMLPTWLSVGGAVLLLLLMVKPARELVIR